MGSSPTKPSTFTIYWGLTQKQSAFLIRKKYGERYLDPQPLSPTSIVAMHQFCKLESTVQSCSGAPYARLVLAANIPAFQAGAPGSNPGLCTIWHCSSTDRIRGFYPHDEGSIPSGVTILCHSSKAERHAYIVMTKDRYLLARPIWLLNSYG